ncbi:helix-turn-helix transcriptional regulator [Methanolobus halotolerans]|uniref:Methanogenesis regulatory protein FilR1 middle domain-containing protein n=1 Tax=Methanolobus halotolerans TaxID=2052935 RepID=A0A4E0Q8Y4_9EURY|nr:transcriptional regulator FilR1 domain-containing protein [Methanolobus halotolerans]TGC11434.1 hypothetical protein CUN85_00725 [Methanolobus halotolerans]
MNNIGPCTIVDPSPPEIFEVDKEFHKKSKESKSVAAITTFLFPNFSNIFTEYIEMGIRLSLIITNELSDKVKSDCPDEVTKLMDSENVEIYVHEEDMHLVSFTQNDCGLMLRLLSNSNPPSYDYKRIFFQSPGALEWGKDLFDHYKHNSVLLTGI